MDDLNKPVVLKARDIHKTFHHPVEVQILKGLDLDVRQGDSVAIMGRSGEGKSSLLHILGTLEKACKGSLTIAGQEISPFNTAKIRNKHLSFIFQSFHLLEDFTTLENILMPARIARRSIHKGSVAHTHAMELLDMVGLSDRASFRTKQLSGGEKQRVAIARSLCNDPDIILADEPSGNLDRKTADGIHDLLLNFTKERGKSLIVVTHDQALADLCDTQYQLSEGLLV